MTMLRDLVRDVLSFHGLTLEDEQGSGFMIGKGTSGDCGGVGRRGVDAGGEGQPRRVAIVVKNGFTQHWDIEDMKERMDKAGVTEGVFIALSNFSARASDLAASSGIIVWERERFERELGRAMLSRTMGLHRFDDEDGEWMGPIGPTIGLTELVPTFSIETKDGEKAVPPTVIDIGAVTTDDGTASKPLPQVPSPSQQPTLPPEGLFLVTKVSKDDAAKMARDILKNVFTVEPKSIPFHIFDYTCLIEMKGLAPVVRKGLVGINAMTGEPERWNRPLEGGVGDGKDAHAFTTVGPGSPNFGVDACIDRAREFVQGINTITIAQKEVKEHVTVYEKRRVSPKMDAVKVAYRGLVYLPVWKVLGTSGGVTVDANDGRIIGGGDDAQGRPAGTDPGGTRGGSGGTTGGIE